MPVDLPASEAVEPAVDRAEVAAAIDEEVRRLPEKYRRPVVLCYLEGQTQEEAARELGWTKGTVSGRLARAKDLLRGRLSRRGLAPASGAIAAILTSESASAAAPVAAGLLAATVRTATAASLGGVEAGSVAAMAAAALRWMAVARLVRAGVLVVAMGGAVAAVGGSLLVDGGGPVAAPVGVKAPATRPRPRLDRYGDPMPSGAAVRLGTVRRRHTGRVVGLGVAPGDRLVTVQADGLARIWDVRTGRQLRADSLGDDAPGEDRYLNLAAVSTDGRLIAARGFDQQHPRPRGPRSVWVWEIEPHRLRHRIEVHSLSVDAIAFAPDGATLATGGFGGDVQLWDLKTGARRASIRVGTFQVHSLAFAPDGNSLVATGRAKIAIWDLAEGRASGVGAVGSSYFPPRFSPDGRLLAVPETGKGIALWDVREGRERSRIDGTDLAFAPDGEGLAVSGDGMLAMVDAATGVARWKAETGLPPVFSADGRTIVTEGDGVLRFLDAATGRDRFDDDDPHQGMLGAVRYSADGRRVFAAETGGPIRVWDPSTARPIRMIGRRGRLTLLAASPDGRFLAEASIGWKAEVSVWDATDGQLLRSWIGPGEYGQVRALGFSADGEAVLFYLDGPKLAAIEIGTGRERPVVQPRFRLTEKTSPFDVIQWGDFSPSDRFLAVTQQRIVHVADLATGEERFSSPCRELAFAPDGRTLAIAEVSPPVVEDYGPGYGKAVSQPIESPAIRLVDLDTGEDRRIPIPADVVALAFSPDGRLLAVAGGQRRATIRIYRTRDGREVAERPLPAHVSRRDDLTFSPDGRQLAAGLDDTTVTIWDVADVR